MKAVAVRRRFLLGVAVALLLAALVPVPSQAELEPVTRVLLVGNSYTHFHMLSRQIERLAASAGSPLRVDALTHGGYTLRMHWMKSGARQRIAHGGYRFVVLQDHSLRPVDHLDEFDDYGERFARAAISAGAQPVLYQTWARSPRSRFYLQRSDPRNVDDMAARIDHAYSDLAKREGAWLAPVGRAFAAALAGRPDLDLYGPDGTHPSWAGSYLAACVLYGTLTGKDPRTASYAPWELPPEQAPLLRELAAHVLNVPAPALAATVRPAAEPPTAVPAGTVMPPALEPTEPTIAPPLEMPLPDVTLDPAPFVTPSPQAGESADGYDDIECNDDLAPAR